jgi:hypothetical protein
MAASQAAACWSLTGSPLSGEEERNHSTSMPKPMTEGCFE